MHPIGPFTLMSMRLAVLSLVSVSALLFSAGSDYLSVKRKLQLIQTGRARSGSQISLKLPELNEYVRREVVLVAPKGIRDPKVELGNGSASGFAYIDFPTFQQAKGKPMNWFMTKLLSGERPVRVDARIQSAAGRATVTVERVEVSGLAIRGRALDYLIRNFLLPNYPDAKIGTPFALSHGIDRLEVRPSEVLVIMARR